MNGPTRPNNLFAVLLVSTLGGIALLLGTAVFVHYRVHTTGLAL